MWLQSVASTQTWPHTPLCLDVTVGRIGFLHYHNVQTYSCSAGLSNPAQLWAGVPLHDY